jgi:starch phosphorylase
MTCYDDSSMPTLHHFAVAPRLPVALEPLRELAYNLHFAWNKEPRELFARIDPGLWESTHENPVELLARVSQERLDRLAKDEAFTSHLEHAQTALARYLGAKGWFSRTFPGRQDLTIAYFSMEYGIHECLPIYSGGLGVLAGDHLKAASDLGLPLVGVGLAYAEGYFRQELLPDGWQGERYPKNDWRRLPVLPVNDADGKRVVIHVDYPEGVVHAQLWRVQVGRVPLYLLDANLPQNSPEARSITGSLYGGDREFRVRQEIMLGVGGVHALAALGHAPTVCHMNEGHSAFLALERVRRAMQERGATFAVAAEITRAGNVFTTHTPVPAGNDVFAREVVLRYLEPHRAAIGLAEDALAELGQPPEDPAAFSMPVLAIRTSDRKNGVSALHGEVSRGMYSALFPELPPHEVPIEHVTNGIHPATWVSDELAGLYARYLGPRWAEESDDAALFRRVAEIPDAALFSAHERARHRLVVRAREWLRASAVRRGAADAEIEAASTALDPHALTIGFARRFATYKRATLLFSDPARLARLLSGNGRPVQLVFAGKAHPQDKEGKELIRAIVAASRDESLAGRIVFLENYDMSLARALVSGVDVWLNTPRRPHEASGTSGMKAAANGVLNVSVLDGWWAEAWAAHGSRVGWAIGRGDDSDPDGATDGLEAEALYDVLEREVVPLFYEGGRESGSSGIPTRWVGRMKSAITHLLPEFTTHRMVKEYADRFYVPAADRAAALESGDLAGARSLAAWRERVATAWHDVRVRTVDLLSPGEVAVGDEVRVSAVVDLGQLHPDDVAVELYHGPTAGAHELPRGVVTRMRLVEHAEGGFRFEGAIATGECGTHAVSARVVPSHDLHGTDRSRVRWA